MQVTSKILLLQNLMTDLSKWLGLDRFADAKSQYDEDGYLVFENILSSNELGAIKDALAPYLDTPLKGRNDFEGTRTNRLQHTNISAFSLSITYDDGEPTNPSLYVDKMAPAD